MAVTEVLVNVWTMGDAVAKIVLVTLTFLSFISWYLILAKIWEGWKLRQAAGIVKKFWQAQAYQEGMDSLGNGPFQEMAMQAKECADHCDTGGALATRLDPSEQIERALRQQYAHTQGHIESGLTWLATTGATAPFVGLFGTVWGIYHALSAIGLSGQASLEKVAGPVGEALIMTAAGLAVALPAVFAYNAFTRSNRVLLANLDAFAHDLHAFLMTGRPLRGKHYHHHQPQRAHLAPKGN
ncbi:biopolymer transporter ExbB [Denitratisoma sp. DHT3]|uniref:MotA/TolQ/ExbB proton channel family protein n=1 Tax=Denitratisoma sp. DHT3 TaxID=1981880 RepID=UPI001198973E|nr:MotA/TolQ/ExbB proton channel family protein [Denitratisoma sp. DHT3]QDX79869.1 biopolymer transporter ExbB [Denitratisoma sp. DHT3]